MTRSLLNAVLILTLSVLPFSAASQEGATASTVPAAVHILTAVEAGKLMPSSVFFSGQSASIQSRNAGGVRLKKDTYVLAALVDTSGYSSQVQQKYQAYLITEEPIEIGGHRLAPGGYGCGFISGDTFVVMDIGGHDLLRAPSSRDANLHRPTPLQVLPSSAVTHHFRLYAGRNFVEFTPAAP